MGKITDKQINAKPQDKDVWLSEVTIYGHGSLVLRVTPNGERLFYFRYTNSANKRITLSIGTYSRTGDSGTMTLAQASLKAKELASLHKAGIKDIKEHLELEEHAHIVFRDAELARIAKEKADAEAEAKRLNERQTVRALFERWIKLEIVHHKDGGAQVRRIMEKDVLPYLGFMHVEDVKKSHIMPITGFVAQIAIN